ncbi:Phospholipase A2 crotoxin acid subunit CA, variant 2 [Cymbomonas tetramitiformis]|uniref:beta-carotene 3-hydroxylase n=1 Tax=Cymbomonas tetramitiformis TaxID=36881 RepID=A0AAE0CET7_9CHLO|nr:Phospholipase A2 crotoxin acid subunit CA, variant 2 [Cymbomonas tetramitiformis]
MKQCTSTRSCQQVVNTPHCVARLPRASVKPCVKQSTKKHVTCTLGKSSGTIFRSTRHTASSEPSSCTFVCYALETPENFTTPVVPDIEEHDQASTPAPALSRAERRRQDKQRQRTQYLLSACLATFGVSSLAVFAVVHRFSFQSGGNIPYDEILATLALTIGAVVGMEMWARWAHRDLWHDWMWNIPEENRAEWNKPIWGLHESHHMPREGAFEANDVFAITNALPAIGLLAYGYFCPGLLPGCCFGAGLGITIYGMAYMFVHDGLVHRRFPTGPIEEVPYLKRVAMAHKLHHSGKYGGVPWGLFLGPQEVEEAGGLAELDKMLADEEARKALAEQI